jgi:hypothetical protein
MGLGRGTRGMMTIPGKKTWVKQIAGKALPEAKETLESVQTGPFVILLACRPVALRP